MDKEKKFLCFDVGGTNVKYGLLTADGEFLNRGKYRTACLDLDEFLDDMRTVIHSFERKQPLSGIGISMPGYIDPSTGYSETAGAVRALDRKNLKQLLLETTDLPIEIENDGNCAAIAEKYNGNAKECSDFVCITIGTGIGGGLFVNGQLVNGHRFRAGEFGYMLLNSGEDGYRNLHDTASTKGLITSYREYKGIPDTEWIEGEMVFEAAKTDRDVQDIIDAWYERLSTAVFNLVSVLNPEKVVIGGAISVRKELFEKLHEKLNKKPTWSDIGVDIEACKYLNDAGMLGALSKLVHPPVQNQGK